MNDDEEDVFFCPYCDGQNENYFLDDTFDYKCCVCGHVFLVEVLHIRVYVTFKKDGG